MGKELGTLGLHDGIERMRMTFCMFWVVLSSSCNLTDGGRV